MSDWINCFCFQKACVHSREWQGITAPLWSWEASTVFVVVSGGRAAGAGHVRFILFQEKHIFKSICGYGHRVWFSLDKNLIKKNNPLLSSSPTCMPDSFCASSYISVSFLPQRRFKSWTRPVDDEWFVSLRCLFAWGRNQLRVFDILETHWSL